MVRFLFSHPLVLYIIVMPSFIIVIDIVYFQNICYLLKYVFDIISICRSIVRIILIDVPYNEVN